MLSLPSLGKLNSRLALAPGIFRPPVIYYGIRGPGQPAGIVPESLQIHGCKVLGTCRWRMAERFKQPDGNQDRDVVLGESEEPGCLVYAQPRRWTSQCEKILFRLVHLKSLQMCLAARPLNGVKLDPSGDPSRPINGRFRLNLQTSVTRGLRSSLPGRVSDCFIMRLTIFSTHFWDDPSTVNFWFGYNCDVRSEETGSLGFSIATKRHWTRMFCNSARGTCQS